MHLPPLVPKPELWYLFSRSLLHLERSSRTSVPSSRALVSIFSAFFFPSVSSSQTSGLAASSTPRHIAPSPRPPVRPSRIASTSCRLALASTPHRLHAVPPPQPDRVAARSTAHRPAGPSRRPAISSRGAAAAGHRPPPRPQPQRSGLSIKSRRAIATRLPIGGCRGENCSDF